MEFLWEKHRSTRTRLGSRVSGFYECRWLVEDEIWHFYCLDTTVPQLTVVKTPYHASLLQPNEPFPAQFEIEVKGYDLRSYQGKYWQIRTVLRDNPFTLLTELVLQ